MRLRPVVSSTVLASAAVLGLLVGCGGGTSEPPAADPATSTSATSDDSASPAPTTSPPPSPSASSEAPTGGGGEVTAADGALTWTMLCADPVDQAIDGNEEDKKTYKSFRAWRCGEEGAATSAAFVLELVNAPADADAARKAMRTGLAEIAPQAKPTDNALAGQPGITAEAELRGREFGYQVVSVGSYLVLFFVTPPDDLTELTDTVKVN